MNDEHAWQDQLQNLKKAKKAARAILSHMVAIGANEVELLGDRPPRFKVGGMWQSSHISLVAMAGLDLLAQATTRPDQWKWHAVKPSRECDCQLLALGIGRFNVTGQGYSHVVSLNFKALGPPTDAATIPFDPASPRPTLNAEAVLDDL